MIGKNEIVKQLAERIYGNAAPKEIQDCIQFCDTFEDIIVENLLKEEKIMWKGFFSMEVKKRAERKGRNPNTNEVVVFPSVKSINCKVCKSIKKMVNEK